MNVNQVFGQKKKKYSDDPCKVIVSGKMTLYECTSITYSGMKGSDGFEKRQIQKGFYFSVDDNKEKIEWSKKKLSSYLDKVPESANLYKQSRNLRIWDEVIGGSTFILGCYLGASSFIPSLNGGGGININRLGLGVGVLTASVVVPYYIFKKPSNKKAIAAVKAYNKGTSKKTSFLKPLKPDFFMLGNAQGTAGISIGWHLGR